MARTQFLSAGYDAVTMRSIAAEADVDAALISYFFGSKRGLFGEILALAANPAQVLADQLPGPVATLPERLLRALLSTWDDPTVGASLRAVVGGATGSPDLTRLLREMVEQEMVSRIAERLDDADPAEAEARAAVLSAQLTGIIYSRYLLAVEPFASMPPDEVVRRMAPALHAALHTHEQKWNPSPGTG
ncbi:TetR family transcriptional regulator [Streptomyces sp. 8K308]|uniref:TetR/AcrR family transcriptional regulator n=1 Tax=Streptomyces sp. 8K308 TaxID=2530388 RepID=UPI001A9D9772|nr:TetR family transcriptional regulator [Streptomyces sp. 8K308]